MATIEPIDDRADFTSHSFEGADGIHVDSGVFRDPAKMVLLFNAARALASTRELDQLLSVIVSEVQQVLQCEGSGVLLYDPAKDDFYWRSVTDKESFLASAREEIRIPKDRGVCGWVFSRGEPALIHDAANDPRIYRGVEEKSGFTTRNMVCVPLQAREKPLGVLYALNKIDNSFSRDDVEILMALGNYVALALENASYYESLMDSHMELERLNRVKNRMLNHLSHELKTPLAVIEASLKIMERRLEKWGVSSVDFPLERIYRNLSRLQTIEKQVGHIVEERDYPEQEIILDFLFHLEDWIDITREEEPALLEALAALRNRIARAFPSKTQDTQGISVVTVFQAAEHRVHFMMGERVLDIAFELPDPALLMIQPHIMVSVIGGLVRNAVENTPDHGKIVVTGKGSAEGYTISVRDYGVGIPESEQCNIFEGFYPIRDIDLYTSGSRYAFNAGGTGTDLLKMKIFSERFGFKIRFWSRRCPCIPTTRDICPGDITTCTCVSGPEECYQNGGTEFIVTVPPDLMKPDQS
jgi:signal transduction histidine kinase